MPATTLQVATAGREPRLTASPPTVSEMPASQFGNKWQCHSSNQEASTSRPEEEEAAGLDITPEEQPCWRWKEGKPLVRLLKESCWEALGKDSELIWVTMWVYFKTHCRDFDHKGSHNLCHTFKEMVTSTGLLGSDVHEVQQVWTGWKDLWVAHCMLKVPKGHPFLLSGASHWITQDHGFKGNPFPKALRWQSGLSCAWCRKEGQNEGMVVNNLWMSHYHLGLICGQCLEYFTTSTDTMCHHLQLCQPALASINNDNDDQEEESEIDNNCEDDDDFKFG